MILVTHNLGVVADLCDTVSVMKDGASSNATASTSSSPHREQPYTQDLLASSPARRAVGGLTMTEPLLRSRTSTVTFPGRRGPRPPSSTASPSTSRPGETLSLVGESGSGKTTIGRAILGLAPVTEGTVAFRGRRISNVSRAGAATLARDIQVVFQDPYSSLNPCHDGRETSWSNR